MLPISYFDRFRQTILNLPVKAADERYTREELACSRFLLFQEAGLEAYYAPFHCLNAAARVVLVGLTPGWTQMQNAFRAARSGLAAGLEGEALFGHITRAGSFSGPMRKNLVEMLDGIGLNDLLRIASCLDLFTTSHHLVHFTSAVSAPIFKSGGNYRGYGPPLLQVDQLSKWVSENFATELSSFPTAVIIPLGRVADEAIRFLQARSLIVANQRCLIGFPHPSGANGHRKTDFDRGRKGWAAQIAGWFAADREAKLTRILA